MRRTAFERVEHIQDLRFPCADPEDKLEDGVLYIVDAQEQRDQMIQYECPCGCGENVMIPYFKAGQQKELTPSWGLQEHDGKVTLSPSVYSTGFQCKSHYFVRGNRIVWC